MYSIPTLSRRFWEKKNKKGKEGLQKPCICTVNLKPAKSRFCLGRRWKQNHVAGLQLSIAVSSFNLLLSRPPSDGNHGGNGAKLLRKCGRSVFSGRRALQPIRKQCHGAAAQ